MNRFNFTSDYPKLVNDMLVYLYTNKLIKDDIVAVQQVGYYIDPKICSLAWEICAEAWYNVWNNDISLVQALHNAIADWDM